MFKTLKATSVMKMISLKRYVANPLQTLSHRQQGHGLLINGGFVIFVFWFGDNSAEIAHFSCKMVPFHPAPRILTGLTRKKEEKVQGNKDKCRVHMVLSVIEFSKAIATSHVGHT